jgi:hypothetical protein
MKAMDRVCLLVLTLAIWVFLSALARTQPAEGMWGRGEIGVVGMTGDAGHILATGKLEAATHEAAEGFFSIGKFSISVPPNGIPADVLRERLGKDVEIVIRLREPRQLETVGR